MKNQYLLFNFNLLLLEGPTPEKPFFCDEFGPFPKSFYTYKLEELCRRLINNERFHVEKPMCLVFEKDRTTYFINDLLLNANLEHFTFNYLDFETYNQYVANSTNPIFYSALNREQETQYREIFSDLSLAEMQSINIYTGGAFSYMNMFLRQKPEFFNYSSEIIKATIIHSIMCCSALTKIPDNSIQQTFRIENIPSDDEATLYLQKRIDAAKTHSIIYLEGFVSTAVGRPAQSGDIVYLFKNLKGKYIKLLSQCPHENEYLIPPTQIKIELYDGERTNSKFKRFKHYFEVSTTNELSNLPLASLIQPTVKELITLSVYKFEYIMDKTKDVTLRQSLLKVLKILQMLSNNLANKSCQNEAQIYASILAFNNAIDTYLNEQDEVNKTAILRTKIQPYLPDYSSISPLFLMSIFTSPSIRPLAIGLFIIGLAGVVVGSFGLAGVIGLGLTASILITVGGLSGLGISGLLSMGSFFSFKNKTASNDDLLIFNNISINP